MLYRLLRSLFVGLILLAAPAARLQAPVVYAVFFYSPTCPHCHEVIANHWPGIQAEFGDQLQALFIDVSTVEGGQIMLATLDAMQIDSNGVPMLIIGNEVLLGSIDIPLRAPTVIREGLAAGGIELPPVAAVRAAFQSALERDTVTYNAISAEATVGERLAADPLANGLAILILALLLASLGILFVAAWRKLTRRDSHLLTALALHGRKVVLLLSLIGLGMSLSLAIGSNGDLIVLLIAAGKFVLFLTVAIRFISVPRHQPIGGWLMPVLALAGLAVAGYLTYVETTQAQAVCGVMGNCNLVQQSPYARVLNIPIGVLGIAAYLVIAVAFVVGRAKAVPFSMNPALLGLLVFGVAFSAYLTFLEPFVIGATCVWCLTSALLMLMLLWLAVGNQFWHPVKTPSRAH